MRTKFSRSLLLSAASLLGVGILLPATTFAAPIINEYNPTTPNSLPINLVGVGGNIWFSEDQAGVNKVGIMNDATGAMVTEVQLQANSQPNGIVYDSSLGQVFVTEYDVSANAIADIDANSHALLNEYPITHTSGSCTGNPQAVGITLGSDGNLWFTEANSNCVGVMNPATGAMIAEYPVTTSGNTRTDKITAGNGTTIYFSEFSGNALFSINESSPPANGTPATPLNAGGAFQASVHIEGMVLAADLTHIYFSDNAHNQIGVYDLSNNTIVYHAIPTPNSGLDDMANGADGLVYFAESQGNKIGAINPSGLLAEYPVSPGPTALAGWADSTGSVPGGIWFTEATAGRIGDLELASLPALGGNTTPPATAAPAAPNTGLAAYAANPLIALLGSAAAAYFLVMTARRSKSKTAKK